jgi:hypothetical protein
MVAMRESLELWRGLFVDGLARGLRVEEEWCGGRDQGRCSEGDTFKDGKGAVRWVRFSTDRSLDVIGLEGTGTCKSRSGPTYWIYTLV